MGYLQIIRTFAAMETENELLTMRLERWFAGNARDLPWRHTKDAYKIWVSEIILQQTRVNQGYDYYLRFVERFPDITSLAEAEEDEVMKYWQGLGYYSRARNMHAAARDMLVRFNGKFPEKYEDIRSLKGVGDYTAAAIASIAYNQPYAVVDGNVFRVLSRLYDVDIPIDTPAGKRYFSELADTLLHREKAGLYNQALMELGALQCLPVGSDCLQCPVMDFCAAYASGKVGSLPVKQGKVAVKPRYFHYFVISCQGKYWLHKRDARDIWRNLYEFPLIETPEAMTLNELQQTEAYSMLFENAGKVSHLAAPCHCKHILTHRIIYAIFYTVEVDRASRPLAKMQCVQETELDNYPVSRLTESYLQKTTRLRSKAE